MRLGPQQACTLLLRRPARHDETPPHPPPPLHRAGNDSSPYLGRDGPVSRWKPAAQAVSGHRELQVDDGRGYNGSWFGSKLVRHRRWWQRRRNRRQWDVSGGRGSTWRQRGAALLQELSSVAESSPASRLLQISMYLTTSAMALTWAHD